MIRSKILFRVLLFFVAISIETAQAYELLSVIDRGCQVHSGFLVGNEDDQLSLLNSAGKVDLIKAEEADQIVVHNLLDFPYSLNALGTEVTSYEVTLLDKNRSHFRGIPVQFVDQLIFFLNDKGTVEVTTSQMIASLKPASDQKVQWAGKPPTLDFSSARIRCSQLSANGSVPSRVLSDPIQVHEFLRNYENGFARFHQLNERMAFYARPMLVKDTVRMGITSAPNGAAETFDIPLINVKFSSGVPFGLQSSTTLGTSQNDWIPFYFPTLSASFEIKSHVFHAVLVTHIPSISGGTSAFSLNVNMPIFVPPQNFYYDASAPFVLGKSYNYLTMFGIDLHRWTYSVGGYFPVQFAYVQGSTREMLARSPQLTARVMYTNDHWRLRLNGAKYDISHDTSGKNPTLSGLTNYQKIVNTTGQTKGYFVRGGWDWDFATNMQAKFDVIQSQWDYVESSNLLISSNERTIAASVSKDFGKYVNIKIYGASTDYAWDGALNSVKISAPLKQNLYGGEFEFIF